MKRSTLNEVVGVLVTAGRSDLAEVVGLGGNPLLTVLPNDAWIALKSKLPTPKKVNIRKGRFNITYLIFNSKSEVEKTEKILKAWKKNTGWPN